MPLGPVLAFLALASLVSGSGAVPLAGWETFGPPLYQVNAVEADPGAGARAYAAGSIYAESQSGFFASDDRGRTWSVLLQAPGGDFYTEILVDPNDSQTILVGSTDAASTRVDVSTDGGSTWSMSQRLSPFCGNPSLAAGGSPGTVYLACGVLFVRSPDDGDTWTSPAAAFAEPVRLLTGAGGALYAFGASGIQRSLDGGDHWETAASAPAACPSVTAFAVSPAEPNVFIAGTGRLSNGHFQCGGTFRSTDAGTTWSASSLSGVYVSDVAIDPDDPSRVYASASTLAGILPPGGVFESFDGGATWAGSRLPAAGASRVALSADGRTLYAATPTGVFTLDIRKPRVVPSR
jgi:hypothetical protein